MDQGERWSQFINQEVDMVVLTLGMVTVGAMIAISMQRHVYSAYDAISKATILTEAQGRRCLGHTPRPQGRELREQWSRSAE